MHSMIFNRPLNENMIRAFLLAGLCGASIASAAMPTTNLLTVRRRAPRDPETTCIAAISWADELSFSTYRWLLLPCSLPSSPRRHTLLERKPWFRRGSL
jgi:hypothetical protein